MCGVKVFLCIPSCLSIHTPDLFVSDRQSFSFPDPDLWSLPRNLYKSQHVPLAALLSAHHWKDFLLLCLSRSPVTVDAPWLPCFSDLQLPVVPTSLSFSHLVISDPAGCRLGLGEGTVTGDLVAWTCA